MLGISITLISLMCHCFLKKKSLFLGLVQLNYLIYSTSVAPFRRDAVSLQKASEVGNDGFCVAEIALFLLDPP